MFTNQPEFDQFSTIEYGRGYQIYVTNPAGVTLTVQGYLSPTEAEFPVTAGWNLVCYPFSAAAKPVEAGLAPLTLGTDYDTVERYNRNTGTLDKYTAATKQFADLKQGEAYYVKALKNTKWKVPAQNTQGAVFAAAVQQNEFVYDSAGERIKKITPQETTIYASALFEKDSNGAIRKHIFAGANRIATHILRASGEAASREEVLYYHSDHLGSSNVLTDSTGAQVQLSEYTPYGSFATNSVIASPEGAKQSRISHYFTGKELDSTGLYYYGARYYNPATAHFTQPDPLLQDVYDPQSLNHYSYCRNNPLIYVDPTGMSWNSINNTLNSYDNGSFYWNFDSHNNYTGPSTVSNVGTQTTRNSSTQFMLDSWKTSQQFAKDISRSAALEAKAWGSAFTTGVNYGILGTATIFLHSS